MICKSLLPLAALLVPAFALLLSAGQPPPPPPPDVHDFVFLTEARPVLVRVHLRVDGRPARALWDEFMTSLFRELDTNNDGFLSKEEAVRVPSADQILNGGLGIGAIAGGVGTSALPTLEELDADKDGKVSRVELATYYEKQGFVPFQFHADSPANNPGLGILGGTRPEPSVDAVSNSIFKWLDSDGDGKLTREELAAAPAVLLKLDENDDEIITTRELVPNAAQKGNMFAASMAVQMGGGLNASAAKGNKTLILLHPSSAPPDFAKKVRDRYRPKGAAEGGLTRKEIGFDEATFAALDVNKDGTLDESELLWFVTRKPDVEFVVRLGKMQAGESLVALPSDKAAPLAGQAKLTHGHALLDLGKTRVELRGGTEGYQADSYFGGIIRQQVVAQFKQVDKANNGYLDETMVKGNRFFGSLFKAIDKDGDGKITEQEFVAYLDWLDGLRTRARNACVTLVLADQSRGLFDLLDTDRDGRLSVRELRGAVKLLDQFDVDKKGYITKDDLPKSYALTIRRGPASQGALGGIAALYSIGDKSDAPREATRGPLWFRKMDRNADGDVSRREFLGTDEQFRAIDTDGDGLISVEEAERYEAQLRKQQK